MQGCGSGTGLVTAATGAIHALTLKWPARSFSAVDQHSLPRLPHGSVDHRAPRQFLASARNERWKDFPRRTSIRGYGTAAFLASARSERRKDCLRRIDAQGLLF